MIYDIRRVKDLLPERLCEYFQVDRSGDISMNATLSMIAELNHDSMVMELSRLLPLEGQGEQ